MPLDHDGPIEHLDDAECRRLLGTAGIGRLGFTDGALPAIVPVTFAVHESCAVIPSRHDRSLMSAVRGAVVALQTDSFQEALGTGWSVTAVGPARVVRSPEALAQIDRLGLFPAEGMTLHGYVTVQLALLRGWRAGSLETLDHRPPAGVGTTPA